MRQIEKALTAQGWRIVETTKGKAYYSPDGVHIVQVHRTPSDRRALNNVIAELRRKGATI